jgi:Flp pilus assembly protein TadB
VGGAVLLLAQRAARHGARPGGAADPGGPVVGRRPAARGWFRVLAGASATAVVVLLTGWPVAGFGLGLLTAAWPAMFGGNRAEQHAISRLEALVGWTEQMHDTITGHIGLEQAIATTAEQTAPEIREPMERLLGRLRANLPLDRVLLDLARDIGDPESADRIIAALILNARNRGHGLAGGAGAADRDRPGDARAAPQGRREAGRGAARLQADGGHHGSGWPRSWWCSPRSSSTPTAAAPGS